MSTSKSKRKAYRHFLLALWFVIPGRVVAAGGADSAAELTKRLADLRAEIETINVEIETLKKSHQSRIDALLSRKLELEAEKLKEDGRRVQVDARLSSLRARAERLTARSEKDRARLLRLVSEARAYLATASPLGIDDRARTLDELEAEIKSAEVGLESAIASLWKWLDAEFKLAVESRLVNQTITVAGSQGASGAPRTVTAELLGLGSVGVLFADRDGRFGRGSRENGVWVYRYFDSKADSGKAFSVFEAARSKKSPGFIELPASSASVVGGGAL